MDTQIDLYKTILYNYDKYIDINNAKFYDLDIDKMLEDDCIHIPEGISHIIFPFEFNKMLKPGDIPNSVTHITFGAIYNKPLRNKINIIIQKLKYYINKYLVIDNNINKTFKSSIIPNSVTHLTFESVFNQPLKKGDIPDSVTHLKFGYNFNQILNYNNIPNKIIELILPNNFNEELLNLNEKNILIGYLKYDFNIYDNDNNDNDYVKLLYSNFTLEYKIKLKIDRYIKENFTKDKLIGNIIHQELIKKVFNPNRLLHISNKYNINIEQLLTLY